MVAAELSIEPLLVTPRKAAQSLAVSERTLWILLHEGRIPAADQPLRALLG